MSIDLVALETILLLMRPSAVLLSAWMGVCGCGWPNYLSVLHMGNSVVAFKNNAPSYASDADDIKLRMIVDMLRESPLFGGFYLSLDMKWIPPARLCALFLYR